jgi:orotidine-5'-phosphate decarboxylase
VAVALDTDDWEQYRGWCRLFGPRVGVLKVGLEAFVRWGARALVEAREWGGAVFLDLKLHDIPATVAGAAAAARKLGVSYLTVHAAGGSSMLRAAVDAAGDSLRLLGVTLLTHLDRESLDELDLPGSPEERVTRWAGLVLGSGCAGAVCSPREVEVLRKRCPRPFLLVTPGIRPAGTDAADQRRTATPAAAVAAGSDLLVVGRPLTRAGDPLAALERLAAELSPAPD